MNNVPAHKYNINTHMENISKPHCGRFPCGKLKTKRRMNSMKKIVSIVLALTLLLSLGALAACSGETDVTTKLTTVSKTQDTEPDMTDETTEKETKQDEEESMTGNVEITTTEDESSAQTTKS